MLFFKKPPVSWPGAAHTPAAAFTFARLGERQKGQAPQETFWGQDHPVGTQACSQPYRGPLTGWWRGGGGQTQTQGQGQMLSRGTHTPSEEVFLVTLSVRVPSAPSVLCGLGRTGFDSSCLRPKHRTHLASLGKPCVTSCCGMNGVPSIYMLRS